MVACSQGQRLDWFDSGFVDALFLMAGWFGACFVANTLLRARPLYTLATFAKVNFSVGLAEIVLFAVSLLGVGTLFPQEQAQIRFLRPIQLGDTALVLLLPVLTVAATLPLLLRRLDARAGAGDRAVPGLARGLALRLGDARLGRHRLPDTARPAGRRLADGGGHQRARSPSACSARRTR